MPPTRCLTRSASSSGRASPSSRAPWIIGETSPHSTVGTIYFSAELTPGAVERIRQEMAMRGPSDPIHEARIRSTVDGFTKYV